MRVVTRCSEEVQDVGRIIQSYCSINLKTIDAIEPMQLKLWEAVEKLDYSLFLKHESREYCDEDAYTEFIPSLQTFIVKYCCKRF
jgi:hypothetical protein